MEKVNNFLYSLTYLNQFSGNFRGIKLLMQLILYLKIKNNINYQTNKISNSLITLIKVNKSSKLMINMVKILFNLLPPCPSKCFIL